MTAWNSVSHAHSPHWPCTQARGSPPLGVAAGAAGVAGAASVAGALHKAHANAASRVHSGACMRCVCHLPPQTPPTPTHSPLGAH